MRTTANQLLKDFLICNAARVRVALHKKAAFENFMHLPPELREFLGKPGNEAYLKLAKQLSEISVERLRALAEALTDLTV